MSCPPNIEFLVKVSYMELYQERIRDLSALRSPIFSLRKFQTLAQWPVRIAPTLLLARTR